MSFFAARRLCACALLLTPLLSGATESLAGGGAPLTLEEAVGRTLQSSPDLKTFGYELTAQDGRTRQAGASPNPELVIDVEDAFGTGSRSGVSALQTTISLRQVLERGALLQRVTVASRGRELLDAELVEKRLDAASEAARRFIQVLSDQARLHLTHEATALAEKTVKAAALRVRAAKVPEAELGRAEAALARTRLEHEDVEHALLTSRRQLAALWGDTEAAFGEAQGQLTQLPALAPYESLSARIRSNPSLLKFSSEARLREAELKLAEQRRRPAWTVTTGLRRFEAGDDFAAVVGISIPLPFRDRGEGSIATAQAQLEQVDASRSATEVRVLTQLFELFQELQHTRHVADTLDTEVLPRVQAALKQTEYAYERGRYSYLELVAAQRELLEVKRARIQSAVDAYGYATEIDRLTGAVPGTTPHK
ncbi:MAG: TolC family protein [Nevskiaceae bacterium]|nr:MAG: TolC family protein [Nevskiaceae bacterium]